MTPEIKEMWEKSTITYPRIYKSWQKEWQTRRLQGVLSSFRQWFSRPFPRSSASNFPTISSQKRKIPLQSVAIDCLDLLKIRSRLPTLRNPLLRRIFRSSWPRNSGLQIRISVSPSEYNFESNLRSGQIISTGFQRRLKTVRRSG
jgi:hypothetical protein